jgi:MFS family permease
MSSSTVVLTLGMILAGRLTDIVGPRWVWGAAACLFVAAAVTAYVLARGVHDARARVETLQAPLDADPAVEAHGHSA